MTWGWSDDDNRALEFPDETTPEVAPKKGPGQEGRGRIIYQNNAHAFKSSVDGAPYTVFGGGSASAAAETAWFIDPVAGNDNNTGTTVGKALKTHEELRGRIGDHVINQTVTVSLLNDFGDDNPIIIDFTIGRFGGMIYRGTKTLTTLFTGTFTGVTPISRAANQPTEVTDASLPVGWGASGLVNDTFSVPLRIRITAGPNSGAISWATKDLGAKTARTSPFGLPSVSVNPLPLDPPTAFRLRTPAVTDPYVVETGFPLIQQFVCMPRILSFVTSNAPQVLFLDLALEQSTNHIPIIAAPRGGGAAPTILFSGCDTSRLSPQSKTSFVASELGKSSGFNIVLLGGELFLLAQAVFVPIFQNEGSVLQLVTDTLVEGSGMGGIALDLRGAVRNSAVCIMDAPGDAIKLSRGAFLSATAPFGAADPSHIYGSGNGGFGVNVTPGSQQIYNATGPENFLPTINLGASEVKIGTITTTWAAVGAAPSIADAPSLAAVSLET